LAEAAPSAPPALPVDVREAGKSVRLVNGEVLTLLSGLTLQVRRGEKVAVMGPSGSGKTTLLRSLGLFAPFDSGEHHVLGVDVRRAGDRRCSRLRAQSIGFVFQEFRLMPNLTALQNVEYAAILAGVPRRRLRGVCRDALLRVGLEPRSQSRPATLSGGEQQRVAIARALVKEPALILADEPTGALDRVTADRVMHFLRGATEQIGAALVLVTHDADVAIQCDRRLVLTGGQLVDTASATASP
jgi:ABC-type lipoprotein export system ATPase subunit